MGAESGLMSANHQWLDEGTVKFTVPEVNMADANHHVIAQETVEVRVLT